MSSGENGRATGEPLQEHLDETVPSVSPTDDRHSTKRYRRPSLPHTASERTQSSSASSSERFSVTNTPPPRSASASSVSSALAAPPPPASSTAHYNQQHKPHNHHHHHHHQLESAPSTHHHSSARPQLVPLAVLPTTATASPSTTALSIVGRHLRPPPYDHHHHPSQVVHHHHHLAPYALVPTTDHQHVVQTTAVQPALVPIEHNPRSRHGSPRSSSASSPALGAEGPHSMPAASRTVTTAATVAPTPAALYPYPSSSAASFEGGNGSAPETTVPPRRSFASPVPSVLHSADSSSSVSFSNPSFLAVNPHHLSSHSPGLSTIQSPIPQSLAPRSPSDDRTGLHPNVTVRQFLELLDFGEYVHTFISEGFDRMESLLEIQEEDFEAMKIKRGHRRIIQRELSTMKGFPVTTPLSVALGKVDEEGSKAESVLQTNKNVFYISSSSQPGKTDSKKRFRGFDQRPVAPIESAPSSSSVATNPTAPTGSQGSSSHTTATSTTTAPSSKRKYRRHPKPDPFAPEKPPSAYVAFTNKVREEMKGKSFAEIARIGGERWQNLAREEKESLEAKAAEEKERYAARLAAYKNTKEYAQYQDYLNEFRKKHNSHEDGGHQTESPPPSTVIASHYSTRSRPEIKRELDDEAQEDDDDDDDYAVSLLENDDLGAASLRAPADGHASRSSGESDAAASPYSNSALFDGVTKSDTRHRRTSSNSLNRIMDHSHESNNNAASVDDPLNNKRIKLDQARYARPSPRKELQQERSKLSLATSSVREEL